MNFEKNWTSAQLIVLVALFIASFANMRFLSKAFASYPANASNMLFLASLFVFLIVTIILVLSLFCHYRLVKPVLMLFLLMSASAAYFMDQYGTIIDQSIIMSIFKTDRREVHDLFNFKLLAYLLVLGALPSFLIYHARLIYPGHLRETFLRLRLALGALALGLLVFVGFWSHYASLFRVHKDIVSYANPVFGLYSVGKQLYKNHIATPLPFTRLGTDAILPADHGPRKLVIMVVGETARADHFSLNGYKRETNPLLKQHQIINFSNFWSCGTLTIDSVPCMFSKLTRASFSRRKAKNQENALDILHRLGVNVLWRDNNSSSKGVADRIPQEDFLTRKTNPVCDLVECRDVGMLGGLKDYIAKRPKGDFMIVLHQMGNHGPAYYRRYPQNFRKFMPICRTNELSACSQKELINSYDNAVLYTDYFLAKVIDFLKTQDEKFATSMIYISDHGESLGERGVYLHGLPWFMAPEAQRHVPALFWFGSKTDPQLVHTAQKRRTAKLSHDNLFSTLLGLFHVKTKDYEPKMDILHGEAGS